jgi:glycogen operon protein
VLWDIESDPVLAGTKLIAEAWDAGGLYQVGSFVGDRWQEWNGRFRDGVRDFLRGAPASVTRLADCIVGSPDVYGHEEREAEQSVNFVTCHDGFTLNDLVSYDEKHNEDNGEENRDGANDNRSWNCGVEGPTDDPLINGLRNRQVKNFLTVTALSLGVPMITMGDEVRRTQSGNNNAYCRDDETNWFDWSLLDKHADVWRFVKLLLADRRAGDADEAHKSLNRLIRDSKHAWHGVKLNQPDWGVDSHSLALNVEMRNRPGCAHLIFNAYWEPLEFELPCLSANDAWLRWIDTALESPHDIVEWPAAPPIFGHRYRAEPHSVVMLVSSVGLSSNGGQ